MNNNSLIITEYILNKIKTTKIKLKLIERIPKVPSYVRTQIGYPYKLSKVDGKNSFGGFDSKAPEGFESFLDEWK